MTAERDRAAELLRLIEEIQRESWTVHAEPVRVSATTDDGEPVL